jgi:hypothetical protein
VSIGYVPAPFVPWWDEAKTGPAPDCEVCGAMMVRTRHPGLTAFELRYVVAPGWICLSCGEQVKDAQQASV